MEANLRNQDDEIEVEYVLLDLNSISGNLDIRPNAPYVLSGLDTSNPILVIVNKFKLVGHYEETIGTCIAFLEEGTPPSVPEYAEGSQANATLEGCSTVSLDPAPTMQPPYTQRTIFVDHSGDDPEAILAFLLRGLEMTGSVPLVCAPLEADLISRAKNDFSPSHLLNRPWIKVCADVSSEECKTGRTSCVWRLPGAESIGLG